MKSSLFSNLCKYVRTKTIRVTVLLWLVLPMLSSAQSSKSSKPVKWTFESKKMSTGVYELRLIARIDSGWRIYSQFGGSDTAFPTLIKFASNPQITLEGLPKEEGQMKKSIGNVIDVGMNYYVEIVYFKQIVRLKTGTSSATITGGVRYTPVNGKTMLALKTKTFSISVGK